MTEIKGITEPLQILAREKEQILGQVLIVTGRKVK
jgi:hypothetical protein